MRRMTPPGPDQPQPDTAQPARDFWIAHAGATAGSASVHPKGKWLRYHAWTRRMLQSWTLRRVAADRPRYARVVDLGCGPGDWSELFAPLADEVHACDVAPAFVEQARARLAGHAAAHVAVSDITSFEIPRGADLVYFGAVLCYVTDDDVRDLLRRVRDVAAPGAHVVIRDYCTFNFGRRTVNQKADYYSVHRPARELRAMASDAGLTCLEMRSSPSIYGEMMGRVPPLAWPLRGLWRIATATWARASYTLRFRA